MSMVRLPRAIKQKPITVTLSGYLESSYAYVTVNGTTTYTAATTLTFTKSPTIFIHVGVNRSCTITLNGTTVASAASSSNNTAEYSFAPTTDCTITFTRTATGGWSTDYYYSASITTE